jgi:hypothetical protein
MLCLGGCTTMKVVFTSIPMGLGLFRSPVVLPTNGPNRPLDVDVRASLDSLADELRRAESRYAVLDDRGAPSLRRTLPGLSFSKEDRTHVTCAAGTEQTFCDAFDGLGDLRVKPAVTFVAFSGGGARAAVMSAWAMERLEKRYNDLVPQAATESLHLPSYANAVDAYSSVSGGSLYAYHVALARILSRARDAHAMEKMQAPARWETAACEHQVPDRVEACR